MKRILVSAPGKAILMGEHAAVYGRPALVASIDRRLRGELIARPAGRPGLRLSLPQIGVEEGPDDARPWADFIDYARDRRRAWERWSADPASVPFRDVLGDDPAHLVRVAVGETLERLGADPELDARLRLHSEIPLGSGFGSSAAAAAVTVRALLELLGRPEDRADADFVQEVAWTAECRQHGSPSGVDTATVIHGGALWVEKRRVEKRDGVLRTEPVVIRNRSLVDSLRIYHSGAPEQSTGEVVSAVRSRRDRDPAAFDQAMDRATERTAELRRLLELDACDPAEPRSLVRDFGAWLEEIGVVPPGPARVVRAVESAGGAAKISGAGALEGSGAGSLLMFHPEPGKLDAVPELEPLEPLDVRFGAPGVRVHGSNEATENEATEEEESDD